MLNAAPRYPMYSGAWRDMVLRGPEVERMYGSWGRARMRTYRRSSCGKQYQSSSTLCSGKGSGGWH